MTFTKERTTLNQVKAVLSDSKTRERGDITFCYVSPHLFPLFSFLDCILA